MLDEDFLISLECQISNVLLHSKNASIRGFWCDGILLPDDEGEYATKLVNDRRKVLLSAYLGKSGEEHYELELNFGTKSLSKYARGLSIVECIPDAATDDWIEIDTKKKEITILLH